MKEGTFDYIVKPVRKLHLVETIKKATRYKNVLLENERLAYKKLKQTWKL